MNRDQLDALKELFGEYPADFYGEAQDFKMAVREIVDSAILAVVPPEPDDRIAKALERLDAATEQGCLHTSFIAMMIRRPDLDHEPKVAVVPEPPAPLEWVEHDGGAGERYFKAEGTNFYIWQYRDGRVALELETCDDGCPPLAELSDVDVAKSLAQSLQNVLTRATAPEPPTPQNDNELPGMWSYSDLTGGATDAAEIARLRAEPPTDGDLISRKAAQQHLRDVDNPYLGYQWAGEWAAGELQNVGAAEPPSAPAPREAFCFACYNPGGFTHTCPYPHGPDGAKWKSSRGTPEGQKGNS